MPLHEIAALLEKHAIKRVPIVRDGQLVGIVSRANLIQALASRRKELEIPFSDVNIRDKLLTRLKAQKWAHTSMLNVTVNDGVVDLWGTTSDAERKAVRVAAETTPGVRAVNDNLSAGPMRAGKGIGRPSSKLCNRVLVSSDAHRGQATALSEVSM